ncbi:hypothetical protein VaNZ11_013652 [Volvox africanus]|uniref:EamA domain-containing protein n=1 Tax=Volvox africanus TaxID=51714 RepID=A0ABQ5SGN0_9CHLO|nr:hypothetical protein VaNZ11_013652 [Volvox africanus]
MGDFITRLRTSLNPQYAARVSATSLTGPGAAKNVRDRPLLAAGDPSVGILPGRGRRLRSQLYGAAVLLVTTVLWASGGPTTKYLFLLPAPPSAALLTACISVITALFLGVGLIGASMESGSGGRHSRAAVSDAAAAAIAPERKAPGSDIDADEAEAEALLHSGMHTTGAAGGALVAACAAAREAAREQERERALWAGAQECALPVLPSHGSYYYSSLASHSRADPADMELGKNSAALANEAGLISGDLGSMGGGSGAYPRRGPSVDGTVAGPSAPSSPSPSSQLQRNRADLDRMPRVTGHDVSVGSRMRPTEGGAAGPVPGRWRLRLLTAPAHSLPAAGLELGIYNVTAAALGAWGMQRISATRSAFLAQATSLLTPLLVWLSGGRVGVMVWIACFCGALGGAMVALDNVYGAAAAAAAARLAASTSGHGRRIHQLLTLPNNVPDLKTASSDGSTAGRSVVAAHAAGAVNDLTLLSAEAAVAAAASPAALTGGRLQVEGVLLSRQAMGAAYVLMSCVFWGLGTVRLGVHSARFRPLQLAAAAAMCYAGLSLLWLFTEILGSPSAGLSDFLELGLLLRNHVTAALLLWAGLGPGALSSYLQVLGQQTVPPAQAQVLFSSTPLWSALIAQLLLPGEAMGPLAWFGGAIMLGASLLASIWQ